MLVPSPAFRSTSLGIMLSVVFVLAAALTLLPAVLAKLGPRVDRFALPWLRPGEHHSPRSAAWGERLWRQPLALRPRGARTARRARAPGVLAEDRNALDQGRPDPRQLAARDTTRSSRRSARVRPVRSRSLRRGPRPRRWQRRRGAIRASPMCRRRNWAHAAWRSCEAIPATDPSARATGADDRPSARSVAGQRARRRCGGGEPRSRGGADSQARRW